MRMRQMSTIKEFPDENDEDDLYGDEELLSEQNQNQLITQDSCSYGGTGQ